MQQAEGAVDDAQVGRLLTNLESQMTKGRKGGEPSEEIDRMMVEIT